MESIPNTRNRPWEQSGSLRTGELAPTLSLRGKFYGRGGSKEQRRALVSRAKAALGHRDAPTSAAPPSPRGSGPARAIRGRAQASGRMAARGAHPRAGERGPAALPRRDPPSAPPRGALRRRGLAHARGRGRGRVPLRGRGTTVPVRVTEQSSFPGTA